MTLRFFDTNPAVLLRGLEFITAIFEYMDSNNEKLLDTEMTSFLPYLLIKVMVFTSVRFHPDPVSKIPGFLGSCLEILARNSIPRPFRTSNPVPSRDKFTPLKGAKRDVLNL
uniref:Uncharacterized protein n=1 Tax=Acrobeloides nanus TaxID=290746 RepID=A0A914DNC1_9BILA